MDFFGLPEEVWSLCLGDKYPMFTLVNKKIFSTFIPKISQVSAECSFVYGYAKNCTTLQLRARRFKNGFIQKVGKQRQYGHDPNLPRKSLGLIYKFNPPARVSTITIGTEGKRCAHPHVKVKVGLKKSEESDLYTFLYWKIDRNSL